MDSPQAYKQSLDTVFSKILMVSSTVRSLSLIAPSGKVRRFEMRKDANLLLNPSQMGEFVHAANVSTSSFYKFLPKLGELR
ncbi:MAG: hypothetical protein DA330_10010, partial [Nitrososphaera sp.]|nr:hypothetical protein [Nitrososphaera sp.]